MFKALAAGVIVAASLTASAHAVSGGSALSSAPHATALGKAPEGGYIVSAAVCGVPIRFILDTGASMKSIPIDFARELYARRGLTGADYRGRTTFGTANGSTRRQTVVTLPSLTVGDRTVYGVAVTIGPAGSRPLLGQTFLKRLGSYTINNRRNMLILD